MLISNIYNTPNSWYSYFRDNRNSAIDIVADTNSPVIIETDGKPMGEVTDLASVAFF